MAGSKGDEPIPDEALGPMDEFDTEIRKFEEILNEFASVSMAERAERCPLEKARAELTTLFVLNSLYWSLLACGGKDPKDDKTLQIELDRAKDYMGRLNYFDELHGRPKVQQRVAKAIVRNALFDVIGPKPDKESSQQRGRLRFNDSSSEDGNTKEKSMGYEDATDDVKIAIDGTTRECSAHRRKRPAVIVHRTDDSRNSAIEIDSNDEKDEDDGEKEGKRRRADRKRAKK